MSKKNFKYLRFLKRPFSEEDLEKLSLVVGFNQSDSTAGWKNLPGYTIYYSHFTDHLGDHVHSFPLSPGLIPNVYFKSIENVFLGKPFTECVETTAINKYTTWVSPKSNQF